MQPEIELVTRLQKGDQAAFAQLLRAEGPRLLRLARRLMRSEDDALDCFQEAMLTVSRRIGEFQGKSQIATWMHRITVNTCLMKLRKASARSETFIDDLMPTFDDRDCRIGEPPRGDPSPDALLERKETRTTVRAAIDQLPDGYRAILILRDIEELSAKEVARALDIKPNAVHVKLHRARAALKKLLEPQLFATDGEAKP